MREKRGFSGYIWGNDREMGGSDGERFVIKRGGICVEVFANEFCVVDLWGVCCGWLWLVVLVGVSKKNWRGGMKKGEGRGR